MRLLQGLSVGGEFVGSLVYAVESAPPARRVFAGSICTASATFGVSLGSWTGLLLNAVLTVDQMRQFGWRIPFFGGVLIGLFAYWARTHLEEISSNEASSCRTHSEEIYSNEAASSHNMPLWVALREHPRDIAAAALSTSCYSFAVWYLTTFPPTLYGSLMQPPLAGGGTRMWLLHALACCVLSGFYPAWGWAGDRFGAANMMTAGC